MLDATQALFSTLVELIARLEDDAVNKGDVIPWASPVPVFGRFPEARVATLGLNPSNREFVDGTGQELEGLERRFHTLASLELDRWHNADASHLSMILSSCIDYFSARPYDRWFRVLDNVLRSARASYYGSPKYVACHLDIIPYATSRKWTDLSVAQRAHLVAYGAQALTTLLAESEVKFLVLNGAAVTSYFASTYGVAFDANEIPKWSLPRRSGVSVAGIQYRAVVEDLAGCDLGRRIVVLGYNHNLQSSFGVTREVSAAIGEWLCSEIDA